MRLNFKLLNFVVPICVLWSHIGFSQLYNRIYTEDNLKRSFVWQIALSGNEVFASLEKTCSTDKLCATITTVNDIGDKISVDEHFGYKGFTNRLQLRNDTFFLCDHEFNPVDSMLYWKLGLIRKNGEKIAEYKFPTIHFSNFGIGDFGYVYPSAFGITLVSNNEAIIWGEGQDNRLPNPKNVAYRNVFMRVGLDGKQKGDIFWFEKNQEHVRRMSDAVTDIDGNMTFFYEWINPFESTSIDSERRGIFKVLPDNSIQQVVEIPLTASEIGRPKIAIDSQGNYYVNPIYQGGAIPGVAALKHRVGFISKVNQAGEVLWTSIVPPYDLDKVAQTEATHTSTIRRISTTKNGDILVTGRAFVRDSFFVEEGKPEKFYSTGNGSFIARFDTNGRLLWRHFVIPRKKDGHIRDNYIYDIKEALDGSIVTGGEIERDDDDVDPFYVNDAWIMRLTPQGCLTKDCKHIGKYFDFLPEIVSTSDDMAVQKLTIYPNPGSSEVKVEVPSDFVLPVHYQISDVQGRIIESGLRADSKLSFHMSFLTSGMYIIMVRDINGKVSSGKWIRE